MDLRLKQIFNMKKKKEKASKALKYFHPDMDDWWYRDFFEREKNAIKKRRRARNGKEAHFGKRKAR